jgi:hypothetical protein
MVLLDFKQPNNIGLNPFKILWYPFDSKTILGLFQILVL